MSFRSRRSRSATCFLPIAALSALALGCSQQSGGPVNAGLSGSAESSGVREREAPRVRVSELEEREMVQRLQTTTVIESDAEIQLIPRSSGVVIEILAEEGDRVEAGAVLARLDDRDAVFAVRDAEVAVEEARNRHANMELTIEEADAEISNAKLAREQAQRDFDRNDRLHGGNAEVASVLSAQALEASRLELESSSHALVKAQLALKGAEINARDAKIAVSRVEVALQRAKITLEDRSIRAPITSVVAERMLRIGNTVGSEAVFVLTDTEHLRAVFYRPQRELALFAAQTNLNGDARTGLEISAVTEALPDVRFRGFIERASPTINPDSGSFRLTARLSLTPEPVEGRDIGHMRLLPGMLVRLEIITDRHPQALVIHKRAVRREGEESFVLKVVDGHAVRVLVEEGFADDDFVEIVSLEVGTLASGDSIITIGSRDLEDGMEVRIEDPDAEMSEPEEVEEPEEESEEASDDDTAGSEDE